MRPGLTLLEDIPGTGGIVARRKTYRIRLQLWLAGGDPVRWREPSGPVGRASLEDDGHTLLTEVRLSRQSLINGLFYGMDGMRVGGTRTLRIAPHLAYAARGVHGVIPPDATLVAKVTVLEETPWP